MRATGPTARPTHSFDKLRAHPLDVLPSGFRFLDGDDPAYPFIACERGNILPCRERSGSGCTTPPAIDAPEPNAIYLLGIGVLTLLFCGRFRFA
jgi:hypothetical protein